MQSTQSELVDNTLIKKDRKKLKEVEDDPNHFKEQRLEYRDKLENLNTEQQARFETLSQNQKDLQT